MHPTISALRRVPLCEATCVLTEHKVFFLLIYLFVYIIDYYRCIILIRGSIDNCMSLWPQWPPVKAEVDWFASNKKLQMKFKPAVQTAHKVAPWITRSLETMSLETMSPQPCLYRLCVTWTAAWANRNYVMCTRPWHHKISGYAQGLLKVKTAS